MAYRMMVMTVVLTAACGSDKRPVVTTSKDSSTVESRTAPLVLLIGTSLTAGYGIDPVDAWPALLQRMADSAGLHFRIVNAGVSGETSADARHRLDWLLSQGNPAVVVVETGANDAMRGQPVASIADNLDAIISRLDSLRPAPVVVIAGMEAFPNMGRGYGQQFRSIFVAAARKHHATYLPFLLTGVAGVDSLNQHDGIHPNVVGSKRVATNVWHTLGPILDSLQRETHGNL
jgi:acyl-CoA thioesterase-1